MHQALARCRTRYALLVDTDIVFRRSVLGPLDALRRHDLALLGEVCGDRGGFRLHPRVHPWFCLIDIDRIHANGIGFHDDERIRATGSEGFFGNVPLAASTRERLYDVGATFYEDIDRAGLRIGDAELEPTFFCHYEVCPGIEARASASICGAARRPRPRSPTTSSASATSRSPDGFRDGAARPPATIDADAETPSPSRGAA